MQQHPIPQNVMSVEFQLVGSLTLRQFAYLGVGGVLAFGFFVLPIYGFIKWPLVVMIGLFFTSLAFLPLNDIGLDRWIIAFFRAVNSPTKRIWTRGPKELPIFARDYAKRFLHEDESPIPVANRSKLNTYLASTHPLETKSELDVAEEGYINSLPFEAVGSPPLPPRPPELTPPVPTSPTIKPLQQPSSLEEKRTVEEDLTKESAPYIPPATTPTKPVITVHTPDKNIYVKKVSTTTVNRVLHSLSSLQGVIVMPVRGEKMFEPSQQLRDLITPPSAPEIVENPPVQAAPPPAAPPPVAPPPVTPPNPPQPTPQYIEDLKMPPPNPDAEKFITASPTPGPPPMQFDQKLAIETKLAQEAEAAREKLSEKSPSSFTNMMFAAPEIAPQKLPAPPPPAPTPPKQEAPLPELPPTPETKVKPKEDQFEQIPSLAQPQKQAPPEKTATHAIPAIGKMAPLPATVPNVIVGLVRASDGLLLTDVVIVVKDPESEPIRALKSNKVGQFAITTPLPNGRYTIDLSKEGYQFDTIEVTLNGQIFQPIEIRAI